MDELDSMAHFFNQNLRVGFRYNFLIFGEVDSFDTLV